MFVLSSYNFFKVVETPLHANAESNAGHVCADVDLQLDSAPALGPLAQLACAVFV